VVAELIATQAEDGYLGPFAKNVRLLKNWDLWGHYHAIQALLLWHDYSGDAPALAAARKAGDLVCNTYLDSGKRVFDAGDSEMNMAILTAMAMLHRVTGEQRYLRMAREVEKDWERAGDYLRAGLDGREYYQSPKPRWESLHDLQGLVEMWRITGDSKYRESFEHHWRSILGAGIAAIPAASVPANRPQAIPTRRALSKPAAPLRGWRSRLTTCNSRAIAARRMISNSPR
jgi:DUF1680 family protein